MEAQERIEEDSMANLQKDGKDEMNLAEFPLCALAHRLRPEQKTLQFEDRVWDGRRGEMITRQLTVTGSAAHGLPTALDDEVLLGLIQISKLSQFAERTVRFTRYQLIQMLGWRHDGKTYERIEASLNRWTGVTLYYKNAWWNKKRQCWVNENFHVLDNVRLFQRGSATPNLDETAGASVFVWNEVVFASFQAGNLKSIDFDFFRALKGAIAKRLYRFLDKRFFHRDRWEFDLKEFAWEHAGMSRSYDVADLKRKLRPGIAELERRGYLRTFSETERFRKLRSGQSLIVFERAAGKRDAQRKAAQEPANTLTAALTRRGVSLSTADRITKDFPSDRIQAQLEVFDYLVAQNHPKVSRNPPGFLVSAIRGEYAPPKAFLDHGEQERRRLETERRRVREERRAQATETAMLAKEQAREQVIRQFWESLSADERERLEQEALAQATPLQSKMLDDDGTLAAATRRSLLDAYAIELMREAA